MTNQSFWSKCGVISIDHFAVTTSDINSATNDYLNIPGAELLRGPGYNSSQNVDSSFVRMASGEVIEILGIKYQSPISKHVENGGGAYHICFIVEDLDYAIKAAKNEGAILLVGSRKDDVFSPRKVCFMMHKNHGLFEFLEAPLKDILFTKKNQNEISEKNNTAIKSSLSPSEIASKAFYKIFSSIENDENLINARYDEVDEWDSLNHLMLIMEVESLSGISFTAKEIAEIRSFSDLEKILKEKK